MWLDLIVDRDLDTVYTARYAVMNRCGRMVPKKETKMGKREDLGMEPELRGQAWLLSR